MSKRQEDRPLSNYFERVVIINLPERTDRRRRMERQLEAAGIDPQRPPVEFFAGIRPAEAGGWPSIGSRGGFLSHDTVLRQAKERGLRNIARRELNRFWNSLIGNHTVNLLSTVFQGGEGCCESRQPEFQPPVHFDIRFCSP